MSMCVHGVHNQKSVYGVYEGGLRERERERERGREGGRETNRRSFRVLARTPSDSSWQPSVEKPSVDSLLFQEAGTTVRPRLGPEVKQFI